MQTFYLMLVHSCKNFMHPGGTILPFKKSFVKNAMRPPIIFGFGFGHGQPYLDQTR